MSQDVLEGVKTIIAKMFITDPNDIDRETIAADVNGWDSLSHTFLIAAIEERFRIQFDPYTVGEFSCVGDMVDEVERLQK